MKNIKKDFHITEGIIEQKDIRLAKYDSILDAIKDKNFDLEPDSTILVLSLKGKMFEINLIGSIIWECLKKHYSFGKIIPIISNYFEADPNMVKKDYDIFIKELLKNKFIK